MKKIISMVIGAVILFTPTLGMAAGKTYKLNISQAIDLAVENDKQRLMDDLNIKIKEIVQQESKVSNSFGVSGPALDVAYKNNVEPIQVETDVEMAKRTKAKNLNNLRLKAYKACLDVLLTRSELEKEQQKLDIIKQKHEMLKVQLRQGKAVETDLIDAEYKVENKELDVTKVKQKLETVNLELKKILNCNLDEDNVLLEDTINFVNLNELNSVDEWITRIPKTDDTVYEKSQSVKIKDKSLEQTSHYLRPGDSAYELTKFGLETAKNELEDAKRKIEIDIYNNYNDLLSQKENAELAIGYANLIEKTYKAAQVKYDNGMASKLDVLNALERKLDAEYQKLSAISDYSYKKAEFENLVKQDISK